MLSSCYDLLIHRHFEAGTRAKAKQPVLQLALKDFTVTFCDAEAVRALKGNFASMKISVLRFGEYLILYDSSVSA